MLILFALACALALPAHAAETETEKQQQIRDMAQETLQLLYKADPMAKAAVKHASGYAVFSDLASEDPLRWLWQGKRHRREQPD